jgi:hypothetical protein
MNTATETGIRDGNHALLCGEILGCLMAKGIEAEPMMLGSDYTNEIVIFAPLGGLPRDGRLGLLKAGLASGADRRETETNPRAHHPNGRPLEDLGALACPAAS